MILLYRWWRRRQAAQLQTVTAPVPRRQVAIRQPRKTGTAGLVLHQARYDLLGILRNGQARFFTLVMPVLFLVIFVSVFGNDSIGRQHIKTSTYYVPGLSALAIIASSFVNLVISVTAQRENGILKRRRATPVPAWVLVAGRTLTAVAVSLVVMSVLIVIGYLAYGVQVRAEAIPAIVVTSLVGSVTFCVLGYALSSRINSEDSAQPVVQAVMLPLYFISGVFIPNVNLPAWLQHIAEVFPVQHLAHGLHTAFDPTATGSGFVANDITVLLVWAAAGLMVALRRFTWMPAAATA